MKLLTFEYNGKEETGILSADGEKVIPLSKLEINYSDMNDLIDNITEKEMEMAEAAANADPDSIVAFFKRDVNMRAPIVRPKQDVICLGINYADHAVESSRYKNEAFGGERPYPIYFSKRVNEAVGDGEQVQAHADIVERLDYEVEIAVIIGKPAYKVSREEALDFVFGYTILNDISARDIQTRHKQWYFGKSMDGFTPIGPWIVTADEIPDPGHLAIKSYVNGELRQHGNTDQMIFDIPYVIEQLSQGITLIPGTIIAMGTPAGVGMGFEPPKFLNKGDEVVCELEGIGTLTNVIGD